MNHQQLQLGYLLHTRPYKEHHLLLDVFTRAQGRVSLLARSVRKEKSRTRPLLQPFRALYFSWFGRGPLYTLSSVEEVAPALLLSGESLYCGFYCNELLVNILAVEDPDEALFQAYAQALQQLKNTDELKASLREFERQLLMAAGIGIAFDIVADSGESVVPTQQYKLTPNGVFSEQCSVDGPYLSVSGALLTMLQSGRGDAALEKPARNAMRWLLNHYFEGREIKSRRLFHSSTAQARGQV